MFFSKCPLRVGLTGGGTDLPLFINDNGYGSVISFPCNLYTYITLTQDIIGYTSFDHKYIINYREREETDQINLIKNDIVREVIKEFQLKPCNVTLTTDVFASHNGLASSSSYLISLIKAVTYQYNLSQYDIAVLAYNIEKRFNLFVGYQDPFGCALGGLKRLEFFKDKSPTVRYLPSEIFNSFNMYLLYTGINRKSQDILSTLDTDKTKELLPEVDKLEQSIVYNNLDDFCNIIKRSWEIKKATSPKILNNPKLYSLDEYLLENKICGAGGGGFFVVFTEKDYDFVNYNPKVSVQIDICNNGVVLCQG